jgi:hypothetical protein
MTKETSAGLLEENGEGDRLPGKDPRYQLVERILATPDFVRSPQISKFLSYICTATFENPGRNLSEQHIGVEVFGREPDYDSAADTIVRSHALRLRRRLEQYFQKAGRGESLHLVIPKGSYTPVFLPAPEQRSPVGAGLVGAGEIGSVADEVALERFEAQPPVTFRSVSERPGGPRLEREVVGKPLASSPLGFLRQTPIVWRYRFLTLFLVILSAAVSVAFTLHMRTHFQRNRRHLLWSRLFTEDRPTQLVLGDSGLVLFHAVTKQYVSLHDYLSKDYSKQLPFVERVDPAFRVTPQFAEFLLGRRYTSMVDATTLSRLVRLPEAIPERTLIHYSRDMHIEDFNSDNVIMIGAQEAVPWVELFEKHMDFVFSTDNPDKHASFLNRNPQAEEVKEYSSYTPVTSTKVYGVIAFLPNLSGNGNVLIVEGLSMVGTEAAIDLVTEDDRILPMLGNIRKPDGSIPHFEMLIESDTLGEGAGPARVVALHLHE